MPKSEPKEKKSRAAGVNLFLKGERSLSQKSATVRKPYPPGPHGKKRKRGKSEFGIQLLEKQRVKWSYGLRESQFKRYFTEASKASGATGDLMVRELERRLDNVVYRSGIALSRSIARHMVSHGHIMMNGRRVTIPSIRVKVGDVITIRPQSRQSKLFEELSVRLKKYEVPTWLHMDKKIYEGKVVKLPEGVELPFKMGLVVDFYSR